MFFIHHSIGKLKKDDFPAETCVEATRILIEKYLNKKKIVHGGYPIEMRYAGPREALLHALIRQNFGCSRLIVGRDHAGVGSFYGMFDAQNVFEKIQTGALLIKPLKFDISFYCIKCDGMSTSKTCPHGKKSRVEISGTILRRKLKNNEEVSSKISRPEVVEFLKKKK